MKNHFVNKKKIEQNRTKERKTGVWKSEEGRRKQRRGKGIQWRQFLTYSPGLNGKERMETRGRARRRQKLLKERQCRCAGGRQGKRETRKEEGPWRRKYRKGNNLYGSDSWTEAKLLKERQCWGVEERQGREKLKPATCFRHDGE